MVTVEALTLLPILKKTYVLTGDIGMENHVSNITIVETFENLSWINGHEFLLMSHSFFELTIDEKIEALNKLSQLHVAAIGIKINVSNDEVSQEVVRHAKILGIPIFMIGEDISYLDVMNPVNQYILTVQEKQMEIERFTQRLIYSSTRKSQYLYHHSVFAQQHSKSKALLPVLIQQTRLKKNVDYIQKEFEHKQTAFFQMLKREGIITHYLQFTHYQDACFFLFFNNKKADALASIELQLHELMQDLTKDEQLAILEPIIGVGLLQEDKFDFKKAFDEVEAAARIGSAMEVEKAKNIFHYRDVVLFDLLELDSERYENYFEGFLDKYLNTEEMIETLTCYFHAQENVSEASKLLFVHPNTLRYRLDKIKNETGLDINDMRSKTILYLYCVQKKLYQY